MAWTQTIRVWWAFQNLPYIKITWASPSLRWVFFPLTLHPSSKSSRSFFIRIPRKSLTICPFLVFHFVSASLARIWMSPSIPASQHLHYLFLLASVHLPKWLLWQTTKSWSGRRLRVTHMLNWIWKNQSSISRNKWMRWWIAIKIYPFCSHMCLTLLTKTRSFLVNIYYRDYHYLLHSYVDWMWVLSDGVINRQRCYCIYFIQWLAIACR